MQSRAGTRAQGTARAGTLAPGTLARGSKAPAARRFVRRPQANAAVSGGGRWQCPALRLEGGVRDRAEGSDDRRDARRAHRPLAAAGQLCEHPPGTAASILRG